MFLVHVYLYQAEINWKPEWNCADVEMSTKQSSQSKMLHFFDFLKSVDRIVSNRKNTSEVCVTGSDDSFCQFKM